MVYTLVRRPTDVPTHRFYNIRSILAATSQDFSGKEYPHDVVQRAVNVTGGWNREYLRNELSESLEAQLSSEFLSDSEIHAMIAEEIEPKVNQIMADVREVLKLAKEFDKETVVEYYNDVECEAARQWDRYLTQAR